MLKPVLNFVQYHAPLCFAVQHDGVFLFKGLFTRVEHSVTGLSTDSGRSEHTFEEFTQVFFRERFFKSQTWDEELTHQQKSGERLYSLLQRVIYLPENYKLLR